MSKGSWRDKDLSEPGLYFVPLGGAGEIGMNLNLYGFLDGGKESWIAVDVGVTFGDSATPGINLIMADTSFIEEKRENLLGVVLTHGHEDHIGALAALWPRLGAPVYATPFTAALIRGRLVEAGLEEDVPVHIMPLGGRFRLGPFDMELITLTHSIPEPNGVAIRTALGTILHTGDWKIDPAPVIGETTDEEALRELGKEGVLAMICDSTNIFVEGVSGSEGDVEGAMDDAIAGCSGRVFVTSFASNIARLATIAECARKHGRRVALAGQSIRRVVGAARDTGYLADCPEFLSEQEGARHPKGKILFICTGSQGMPEAALARIAEGSHRHIEATAGDRVIFSSREIPGNEKDIARLYNLLARKGVEVVTPESDANLHASGHPCRDELASMYSWVRPRLAIPVHGELRHMMEHAAFAKKRQVPDAIVPTNGSILRLAPGAPRKVARAKHGRYYLDGRILLPAEDNEVMKERIQIGRSGVVSAAILLGVDGLPVQEAMVSLAGVPERDEANGAMKEHVLDAIDEAFRIIEKRRERNPDAVHGVLRRFITNKFRHVWGKTPKVHLHILEMDEMEKEAIL